MPYNRIIDPFALQSRDGSGNSSTVPAPGSTRVPGQKPQPAPIDPTKYYDQSGKDYSGTGNSYWQKDGTWYQGTPDKEISNYGYFSPWDPKAWDSGNVGGQKVDYYDISGKAWNGQGPSYWFNANDNSWYEGQTNGNIRKVGERAPWGDEKSGQIQYYAEDGSKWNGQGKSYWYNENDKTWYEGDTGGRIRAIQAAPWNDTTGTSLEMNNYLKDMMDWFTSNTSIDKLAGKKKAALIEQLRGAEGTSRQQLADQLAAQGITGGQNSDILSGLERDYALGLSQGLSGIDQTALQQYMDQKGQALKAALQLEDSNRNFKLQQSSLGLQKDSLGLQKDSLGLQKDYYGLEKIKTQLQNEIANGQLNNDTLQLYMNMLSTQGSQGLQQQQIDNDMKQFLMKLLSSDQQFDREMALKLLDYYSNPGSGSSTVGN
jgi:hypothetical protein